MNVRGGGGLGKVGKWYIIYIFLSYLFYRYSIYDIKRFINFTLLFCFFHSNDALKFGKFYNIRYYMFVTI